MSIVDEIVAAHGGVDAWRATERVRVRGRAGGLLLRTRVPDAGLGDIRVEATIGEPYAAAESFPSPGSRAVFDHGIVRIESDGGEVLRQREDPRSQFFGRPGIRRNFRWDELDFAYFAGYAWWNYLNHPLLLLRDDVRVSEGDAASHRRRALAQARRHIPRRARHPQPPAELLLRRTAAASPPRLRRRGRRPLGARGPLLRRASRGGRPPLPDETPRRPDRAARAAAAGADPGRARPARDRRGPPLGHRLSASTSASLPIFERPGISSRCARS